VQRTETDVEPFETRTAREWVESAMGRPAWDEVWGPLLRGKFGDRADEISAAWLWGKLSLRRQTKGKEARQELLGYPRRSFEQLYTRLREEVESRGGRVLIDRPAQRVERREPGGYSVWTGLPGSFRRGVDPHDYEPRATEPDVYDAVVATVPSDVFVELLDDRLLESLGDDYGDRLRATEYQHALCLLLEIDRRFSPYYWTNIAEPDMPFIGLIEQTNFVEPERYGGRRFLYVANYLAAGDPLLELQPDELIAAYLPGLQRVNPEFSTDWIRARWLFREAAAQPVVTVGYHERIPPLETGVPGLVLANTTQIYPEDRGTNYSVRLGDEAAEALLATARTPISTS
jgi:protoporphyrinogen oxidase